MRRHHIRTLQALFAHPLQHGVRASRVEALLRSLGAQVSQRDDRRLQIRMSSGQETWIHSGSGLRQPDLDADAVMRVRHFLQEAGVSPDHPEVDAPSPRGDQAHRLVLHLDHRRTDVFRLEGEEVEHAVLRPHGIWGTDQNLTHRHDRDQAGQRAPIDTDYLARITEAMTDADAVLLLGHGTGESDMRQVLLHYLETHRRDLMERIVGVETLDDSGLSDEQMLAVAREHFGNLPHRRPLVVPGQEVVLS
ncbi:hypothetical protein KBY66_00735 [Synechococcus sp. Tobar12-5m-g]|uniref:hypothetical protein n=1 Tax=unclassified Synechococcus TaxID=2626047 RepID=UPI0020CF11BD|nr:MULTISPECIES: hypothetical protein [unclassified Synechococcus]MCP9771161.1 hypothetical protein [Synechococcus sp. Tobar12-5m-g]MCP9872101.1 hypothetical protein [Synechococcus sp. Cruz CV-v-12]